MTRAAGHLLLAAGLMTAAACAAMALAVCWPMHVPTFEAVRAAYVPSDAWLLDRQGVVLDSRRLRFDIRRQHWVPLGEVSPALVTAIIAGEDRHFWQHDGVDWSSALGATRDQLLHHSRRGASTITMQLASLLEHRPARGGVSAWLDKLAQVRTARALEARWTKAQILEAYLNLLEYQGELQGIGAAAARLAGKTPSGLSLPESLVLAALLPQPAATPERVAARACARARSAGGVVDCASVGTTAQRLLAANSELDSPHLAPHLAQALLKQPGEELRTTLDAGVQRLATEVVRSHLLTLSEHNVRDGAVLVVDNATGEVLAYVGSAGPSSRARNVDGVQALRQAGSTLKPFLYELAFEKRYLTAASLLNDSPLTLGTARGLYIPQDYDHEFKGLVSARTALAGSLNVPAVRTLVLVGVEAFRRRLHELGYAGIRQDGEYYGYALALGSAEVTLWQQAQAYRALARGGEWSPLTLRRTSDPTLPQRLLPADASFIVADVLADPAARAVTFGLDNHLDTAFWTAAKTGTSEDMRDNWCIGFSQQFTVAVWVGNFEGDSMHEVSGVTGAAPIWHDLMAALHRGLVSIAPEPPPGVAAVVTHFSPAAEPTRREWYLRATAVPAPTVAALPASVLPKIETPSDGMVIALDPDIPVDHQRVLISVQGAQADMRLKLNDRLLGSATVGQFWYPHPGTYRLTLEDSQGHLLDRVAFRVRGARM